MIVIAACAVVIIALGIFLGNKLTKKEPPTEAPTETPTETPTEAPKETKNEETTSSGEEAGADKWVLYKTHEYSGDKKILDRVREYFYDEQGRLTEEKCYDAQGSLDYTDYYSYDYDGERVERWQPDRDGKLYSATIWDMSGEIVVHVDGHNGETYQEDFYDDGFIKEFRVYGNSDNPSGGQAEKKLLNVLKWEYDAERKNIRRISYTVHDNGELKPVDDLRFELDSEGRVVRCVTPKDGNKTQSVTEYRYEGNRRIETVTEGASVFEIVYEGGRIISRKSIKGDGTGWREEYYYPNVNSFNADYVYTYVENEITVKADGTETPKYKIEFTNDGQPLRKIDLETGEVLVEYQYGSDRKLSAVLAGHFGDLTLRKVADIKLDQYGKVVECTSYGIYARYEWIRLSDAEK